MESPEKGTRSRTEFQGCDISEKEVSMKEWSERWGKEGIGRCFERRRLDLACC